MQKGRIAKGVLAMAGTVFVTAAGGYRALNHTVLLDESAAGTEVHSSQTSSSETSGEGTEEESAEGEDVVSVQAPAFQAFEATAYCDPGITFSGVTVKRGIVAADPRILPIGSVIEIAAGDYSGIYTVMDTGGVIKGRIIDIFVPEFEEAIEFGRQQVKVRVIRRGWNPEEIESFGYTVAG